MLPGLAPMVMKLSVKRVNLHFRSWSTLAWNHSRCHFWLLKACAKRARLALGGVAGHFKHHAVERPLLHLGQVRQQPLAVGVVPPRGDELLPYAHVGWLAGGTCPNHEQQRENHAGRRPSPSCCHGSDLSEELALTDSIRHAFRRHMRSVTACSTAPGTRRRAEFPAAPRGLQQSPSPRRPAPGHAPHQPSASPRESFPPHGRFRNARLSGHART